MAGDLSGRIADADASWMDGVWHQRDVTPGGIADALRDLLRKRHAESESYVPARVLNLVVIADREWRGEIQNRLEGVGRYHASRTIFCSVEPGRETLDALATMTTSGGGSSGQLALCHEEIVIDVGPKHLSHLHSIVDPLVVPDLATVVWSPHGYPEAVDSLSGLSQVVLVDSVNEPSAASAIARAGDLARDAYVVDLAWLRSVPWRERIAATFDPHPWREELGKISAVTVSHRPDSVVAGVMFLGWLASALGWEPGSLLEQGGSMHGNAHGRRQDVQLRLEPDATMNAPGLAGIHVETASGMSIALDRGAGGLRARRRTRDGKESTWTVMGASRGEAGILGEGIRQALLRDPTYKRALATAEKMVA